MWRDYVSKAKRMRVAVLVHWKLGKLCSLDPRLLAKVERVLSALDGTGAPDAEIICTA